MPDINVPGFVGQRVYAGSFGNASVASAAYTAASLASGTNIHLLTIPNGSLVYDGFIITAALGTGVTLQLKLIGNTTGNVTPLMSAAASAASAARLQQNVAPVATTEDCDLVATVGGAAATGLINAVVEYVYNGLN